MKKKHTPESIKIAIPGGEGFIALPTAFVAGMPLQGRRRLARERSSERGFAARTADRAGARAARRNDLIDGGDL